MRDLPPVVQGDRAAATAPSQDTLLIYCSPCLGIPPIVIESPLQFFGTQMLLGVAGIVVLVLWG
jgi:hypothetical protein